VQKITPHLWFDKEARQAAEFYVSVFPNSGVTRASTLKNTPSGDCDVMAFQLGGQPFMAISAGSLFKVNPSISFVANFDPAVDEHARARLDAAWQSLSNGGKVLMPLDKYPFSERYGWVQDRFGVSWQLILSNPAGERRPFITPFLAFTGAVEGRADEAIEFYSSVFSGSARGRTMRYPPGLPSGREGTLMFADFRVADTWLAAMDSAHRHEWTFNEAISLVVPCDTQEEIDHCWKALSADPKAEACGWLKDKFGVSWQVTPSALGDMLSSGTPQQTARVTRAFLAMKKFDLAALRKAFDG
jgi:predicted 3-demethylubiquinone-9 3-methyltransferase (glyoxalase superfamily)